MSGIRRKKIAGKQIYTFSAFMTWCYFNPKKVFYMGVVRAAHDASRSIKVADFLCQCCPKRLRGFRVSAKIKVLDFLFNNPIRHRVDVKAGDITANTVCL